MGGSDYANGFSPVIIIDRLRTKLSDCETQQTSLHSHLQHLLEQNKNLHVHNLKLIKNNRCNLQKISNLETRKNQLMLQQEELENQAAYLRKDLEESERERWKISKDLGYWRKGCEIIEQSKREIEKHMEMFREATAQDRNEIVNNSLEEFYSLRQQLINMEDRLKAEEEITKEVQALRTENNKMQARISGLKKQNCALKLHVDNLQRILENQKEQNFQLQEEIEEMEKQSCSCSSYCSNSKQLLKLRVPGSAMLTTQHTIISDMYTKTPEQVFFSKEIDERWPFLTSKRLLDENQYDPLEEYIHLSVLGFKIRFPNVDISRDKLIQMAKAVPFYNVHDVLSKCMEEKLIRQKTRNKGWNTSVCDKIRGFLPCGALLEHSQKNEIEIDLRRKSQRPKLVTKIRFSV